MSIFKTSGKPVTVPAAVPDANTAGISAWQQLMHWEIDGGDPVPVDLVLDVKLLSSVADGFPEVWANNFAAGGRYVGFNWDDAAEGCVAIKVECGTGNLPRTLYADCRGGRYALGPNQWVRVSVARWLAAGNSPVTVQGGLAPSDGSGDYFTYSAVIDGVAAASSVSLAVPPGAVWFDFYPFPDSSWSAKSIDTPSAWVARRYESAVSPVYNPPSSPLPLISSNGVTLTNDGAAAAGVMLVFWVR